MLDLLRAKFSPLAAELIATSEKSLAEPGKSPFFSIGLQLHHKNMFDTIKWKKNMLGQALLVGESDVPACGPPASFSVHLASSAVTPAGSVHKSRGDNVVRMWVQLKR